MRRTAPSSCPVCGGKYEISTLTCKKCQSQLSGHFSGCKYCDLDDADLQFLTSFLKCRGSIKEVEKDLGISYPTVRGKLDKLLNNLDLASTKSDELKTMRGQILEQLANGEISADEAILLMKQL